MNGCAVGTAVPLSDVKNEVSDLAIEVVLVDEPVGTVAAGDVRIGINYRHALEVGAGNDSGHVEWIADHLCHVEHQDWGADEVLPRWKVDDSGSCG